MEKQRLASKLFRIKFSEEIRKFVNSLPIEDLAETQVGDYVYCGHGRIVTGINQVPVTVKIVRQDFGMMAKIASKKETLIDIPFNSEDERRAAGQAAGRIVTKLLN